MLSAHKPKALKKAGCQKAVLIVCEYLWRFDPAAAATIFFLGVHRCSDTSNKVNDLCFQHGMVVSLINKPLT